MVGVAFAVVLMSVVIVVVMAATRPSGGQTRVEKRQVVQLNKANALLARRAARLLDQLTAAPHSFITDERLMEQAQDLVDEFYDREEPS